MKRSLALVGIISTFLFSSLVYASALNGDISLGGNGEGSLGNVITFNMADSSKEIKNTKVTSSKKDENIQKSKNNKNSSDRISQEELDRLSRIAARRDPGAPNYRGAPVR